MKNARRFLGVALAVMMILSTFATAVSAVTFSDVDQNASYKDAIMTLSAFGIIKGYDDGTFKPNQNVTRAEFTAMLMRTLNMDGIGNSSSANLPFSDVSDQNSDISWSIHNIDTAYGMKIVNGYEDGTFRPSDNVAYEEAVKMIVCALGYGANVSVDVEPWYANYMSQAAQIGITQNAASLGAAGTPASRACIAQLLYDSLDVKLVKNNELSQDTVLSDYWKVVKNVGVIAANGVTSLDSPDINLRDDEIQIYAKEPDSNIYETRTYKTTDATLKNYLGYQVEYYYVDNRTDVRELKVVILKSNEPMTINAKDVDANTTTRTQIRYYKSPTDRNTTVLSLDTDNVVIYNGKLYGPNRASSAFDVNMIPEVGNITLIDSNRDGKYDVINIMDYEVYYVSSKTQTDYSIVDNVTKASTENKKLVLDVEDTSAELSIVNKAGNEVSYASIVVGNLICYAESNTNNGGTLYRRAVVLNDVVTGEVTGREAGESITVSGKKYQYSNAAPWVKFSSSETPLAEPKTQDNYTFVLDLNGDVVAYDKKNSSGNAGQYGYIVGYSTASDKFEESIEIKVLTAGGQTVLYNVYKGTRVNGEVCSTPSQVLRALEDAAEVSNTDGGENLTIQQVIKYTTKTTKNEGTVLDSIITAEGVSGGKDITDDTLYMYDRVNASEKSKYTSSAKSLTASNGGKVNIGSATIFLVPSNRRDYTEYKKGNLSLNFKNGGSYNVEVFDMSTTNAAKVVVLYDANSSTVVDSSSPVYVLQEMGDEINENEGGQMTKIKGYMSSYQQPRGTFDDWLSPESVNAAYNMKIGSIFRAGTDNDGYTQIIDRNDILYSYGEPARGFMKKEDVVASADYYEAEFTAILGSVIAVDDYSIVVAPEILDEGDALGENYPNTTYNFNISDFSSARSLKYDTAGRDLVITDVSSDYESVIQGLSAYNNGVTKPAEVLIYMSNGKVRLFCVLAE